MNLFYTHPDNPQDRHLSELATQLNTGGVLILPTQIGYCFAIGLSQKTAFERLKNQTSTPIIACQTISQLSQMGIIHDSHFRALNALKKSDMVFYLTPTKHAPKHLYHKKSVATLLAHTNIINALIDKLAEPLVLLTLAEPLLAYEIEDSLSYLADSFVNVGDIPYKNITMIDLSDSTAVLMNDGDDDGSMFF